MLIRVQIYMPEY